MQVSYYPITIDEDEYNEGVDSLVLDGRAIEVANIFHKKFTSEGLFYEIFSLEKDDEIFQDIASQVREKYNEYVMRVVAVVVQEPWIDYLDTEFEGYYDYNHEKWMKYSNVDFH